MKIFRKLLGMLEPEPVPDITTDPPRPARKRRTRRPPTETATLSPKEQATAEGRPWVNVLGLEFDPQNPTLGSFELDWNELFVKQLLMSGYQGETEEQIVDQWFQGICRHVVAETWEQVQADPTNRVSRKDLGNGRTEVG
jgi:hypothetical protein